MPKSSPKAKLAKKMPKDEVRTVRLELPVLEKLNDIAAREDRTVSYLLNRAVKEFVERAKK